MIERVRSSTNYDLVNSQEEGGEQILSYSKKDSSFSWRIFQRKYYVPLLGSKPPLQPPQPFTGYILRFKSEYWKLLSKSDGEQKYEPLRSRGGDTQTLVVRPLRSPLFSICVFPKWSKQSFRMLFETQIYFIFRQEYVKESF